MLCQPWTHAQTMFCSPVNQDALSQVRIDPAAADPWVMFSEIQLCYFNTLPPLQDTGQGMARTRAVAQTCRKKTLWQDKQSRENGFSLCSAPDADHPAAWEIDVPHLLAGCYWRYGTGMQWQLVLQGTWTKLVNLFFCCLCIKMKTSMIYSWRLTHLHLICRDVKDKHFYDQIV